MKTKKIYSDAAKVTNYRGRALKFVPEEINGQTVYMCEVPDDVLTEQLLRIPRYTDNPPVTIEPKIVSNKKVLVGSFNKATSYYTTPYYFKPHSKYPFNVCSIPAAHAFALIEIKPEHYWLVTDDDVEMFEKVQAIKQQRQVPEKKRTVIYTVKEKEEKEKEFAEMIEKSADKRNVNEVVRDIYVKDAKRHGYDLGEETSDKKAEKPKPKKKKTKSSKMKKIIEKGSGESSVEVSETIEKVRDLVTPEDIPDLNRDLEKAKIVIPTRQVRASEMTYRKVVELFADPDKKFTIEELNHMLNLEKDGKNRRTVLKIIKKQIQNLKGV
jgi:hypothetical protein